MDKALLSRIQQGQARIAIIGMGYVGFPLAIAVHRQGYHVVGYDTDFSKVQKLCAGTSYITGIESADIAAMLASGRFEASADARVLSEADVVVICVPTPLARDHTPDLSHVRETAKVVAANGKQGQLVVLESTSWPGTTMSEVLPLLAAGGRRLGHDFYLAYSPEREDPGNGFFSTHTIPKVVSGADEESHALAMAFYERVVAQVVPVSSTGVAEAVKLTENIFRSVNIAMVNELKVVYDAMGIDVWEVIAAASTKPFGYMPFYPGPGVGGHCIPVDPFYLSWKAKAQGQHTPLIELAGRINHSMPDYVIQRLSQRLEHDGVVLAGARVLLLGIAYKSGVDDLRESPALVLLDKLTKYGAEVFYHDPFIPTIPATRSYGRYAGMRSVALSEEMLAGMDAAIVVSGHDVIDYNAVLAHVPLVVDTRCKLADGPKVLRA